MRPLESRLNVAHDTFEHERPPVADEDVHMLTEIVDHVIARLTLPGQTVFDPFAGYGTTLSRAAALGRDAVGVELLPERVEHIRGRVPQARIVEGDARALIKLLPGEQAHLVLTSPPYMTRTYHPANPLTAYEEDDGDYGRYLAELELVARQCAHLLHPGGMLVWNVANIKHRGDITPLIDDCAALLTRHLTPVSVTEIVWDTYPHDLVRDALLVFACDR